MVMRPGYAALAVMIACSGGTDTAQTDPTRADGTVDTGAFSGPWVQTTDEGDGTFTTQVVAVSQVDVVYFSFTSGEVAVGSRPPEADWHLAFQREHILINGGISGSGTVEAAELRSIPFDAVRYAPVGGWAVDEIDADANGEDEEVLYTWFDYDYDEHVLIPTLHTFVVRTPDGDVRMWVETYYLDPASYSGSGYPLFHWAWITEPGPLTAEAGQLRVNAQSGPAWLSLREQVALVPPDPLGSSAWDLALQGPVVAINGGVSGAGGRMAVSVAQAFDAVTAAPPVEAFATDEPDSGSDGIPEYAMAGAFVDSDGSFVPADVTWVVSRPDGTADKLRFEAYESLGGDPGFPLIRVAPLP